MIDFFTHLFDASDFPARWHCGNWSATHGWMHVVSDVAIWGAYMTIPAVLGFFIVKRKNVPFTPVFWLFAAFIFACGATHLIDATMFWWPAYRLSGTMKAATAVISWLTVLALIPVVPKALNLPDLERVNKKLSVALLETKRAEEHLRVFIEATPNGLLMMGDDGNIKMTNSAAAEIFGYEDKELVGQAIEVLVPRRHREAHPDLRDDYLGSPRKRSMGQGRDLFGVRRDGTEIPVEIGLNPIQSDEGRMVVASVVDISERKKAESTLGRYTHDLERSNQELDEFAYVASHDLKAPLRAIDNLARWISEDAADVLPVESAADLGLLQSRVRRMEALLDDLLEYSRVGRMDLERREVDTKDIVNEIIQIVEPPPGIKIHVDDSLPVLLTEPTPLRQVLLNLIENAIKHHDKKNGKVEIKCEQVNGQPVFQVQDDGPGIPEEFRERAFQLFQTYRPRDEVEGSGMGLAIVRKVIESHGGTITLESQDRGSTFRFSWPSKAIKENVHGR